MTNLKFRAPVWAVIKYPKQPFKVRPWAGDKYQSDRGIDGWVMAVFYNKTDAQAYAGQLNQAGIYEGTVR